ncbi:diguanylate cyclase domain-containing protein [Marinomonas sp. 2405UD68-3]|uniref:diguanylate cyclase domain-containing protein n=1 Tax=Marinomonas sp. 2405UD68-3 TaxID=3391835 RepID=UPI0039C9B6A3
MIKKSLLLFFPLLVVVFIFRDFFIEESNHQSDFISAISNLEDINENLNYKILYNQSFYHDDFEPINIKIASFNRFLDALEKSVNEDDEETLSIIYELKERFLNKESLIGDLSSTLAIIKSSINFLALNFERVGEEIFKLAERKPELKDELYKYRRDLETFWFNELLEIATRKGISFGNFSFPKCSTCSSFLEDDIKSLIRSLEVLNKYTELQQEYSERLKRTNVELSINTLFYRAEDLINKVENRDSKQRMIIIVTIMILFIAMCSVFYFIHISRKNLLLSKTDLLTGLGNRNKLTDYFDSVTNKATELPLSFGMLFIDLDGFKRVNDVLGHTYGDKVLKTISTKLSLQLEDDQELIRFGGDEFIIILPNMTQESLEAFACKLVRNGHESLQKGLSVSLSIGGVLYPQHATTLDGLIILADQAMYKAKEMGKAQFYMHS